MGCFPSKEEVYQSDAYAALQNQVRQLQQQLNGHAPPVVHQVRLLLRCRGMWIAAAGFVGGLACGATGCCEFATSRWHNLLQAGQPGNFGRRTYTWHAGLAGNRRSTCCPSCHCLCRALMAAA